MLLYGLHILQKKIWGDKVIPFKLFRVCGKN